MTQAPLGTQDPEQVDGYRIVRRLAEGGQGVVYLALSPDGEQVALKLLRPAWLAEPMSRDRLVKEIAAARTVARFCVAQVLDANVDGDAPYVVSEFVEGPSLAQHVRARGVLAGSALDRLAVATATALVAIHRARIVHRDLKPSNVMLGPDGPRVIDFGIARDLSLDTTVVGRIVGSPNYMSPEQLAGAVVGPKADVFSWGCTLVYAATGRAPFTADDLVALMYKVVHETPDTSGVPQPLRAVVDRCLAKDPDDRPGAQELLLALLGGTDDVDGAVADGAPAPDVAAAVALAAAPSGVPDDPTLPTSLLARATALPDGAGPPAALPAARPAAPPAALPGDPTLPTMPLAAAAVAAVPHTAPPPSATPPAPPVRTAGPPPPPSPTWQTPLPAGPPAGPPAVPGRPRSRGGVLLAVTAGAAVALLLVGGGLALRDRLTGTPDASGGAPAASAPAPGTDAGPLAGGGPDPASPAVPGTPDPTPPDTGTVPPTTATAPPTSAPGTPSPPASTPPPSPTSTRPARSVPPSFAGTWTGTATQPNGIVTRYDVTLRLPVGKARGTIASSALGCTAVVDVVGRPTNTVLVLRQTRTSATGVPCALEADITMHKKAPNRAAWTWVDASDATNVAAATLAR